MLTVSQSKTHFCSEKILIIAFFRILKSQIELLRKENARYKAKLFGSNTELDKIGTSEGKCSFLFLFNVKAKTFFHKCNRYQL